MGESQVSGGKLLILQPSDDGHKTVIGSKGSINLGNTLE